MIHLPAQSRKSRENNEVLEEAKHWERVWKESGELSLVFQGQGEELSHPLRSEDSRKEKLKQEQLPALQGEPELEMLLFHCVS